MAQVLNTDQIYTRVRNASGKARSFGYLGTHGLRLDADEVKLIRGDLVSSLGGSRAGRKFAALERDLLDGVLVIEQTPPPVLYDTVDERSRVLALQNNILGTVDPAWDETGSSEFADNDG